MLNYSFSLQCLIRTDSAAEHDVESPDSSFTLAVGLARMAIAVSTTAITIGLRVLLLESDGREQKLHIYFVNFVEQ